MLHIQVDTIWHLFCSAPFEPRITAWKFPPNVNQIPLRSLWDRYVGKKDDKKLNIIWTLCQNTSGIGGVNRSRWPCHSIVHGSNVVRLGWHTTCQTPRHSIFSFSECLAVSSFQTAEWHDVWLVSLAWRSMTQLRNGLPVDEWKKARVPGGIGWWTFYGLLVVINGSYEWLLNDIHDYLWIKWSVWGIEVINVPTWLDMLRPKAFGPSKQLAVNLGNGGPSGTETPSPLD